MYKLPDLIKDVFRRREDIAVRGQLLQHRDN